MYKTAKIATNGALIVGIGNLIFNIFKQINAIEKAPTRKFDWGEMLGAGLKGAAIGGIGGATVGAILDSENAQIVPINAAPLLSLVAINLRLDKNSAHFSTLSERAKGIENVLSQHFEDKLAGPLVRIGSTEEDTALDGNYDIDISLPFSSKSFKSTEEMYLELLDFVEKNFDNDKDLIQIRKQKKSIGLIFQIEGEECKIDLVPIKLTDEAQSLTKGYLHVHNKSYFGNSTYTKTDLAKLSTKFSPTQQQLLVSLKHWKNIQSVPISSHLISLFILDAYSKNKSKPRAYDKKILMVIRHIHDNILLRRIISPENSNNVVTDLDDVKKQTIKLKCKKVLDDFEYQPNSIINYFK